MAGWLDEAISHPYIQEAERRLQADAAHKGS